MKMAKEACGRFANGNETCCAFDYAAVEWTKLPRKCSQRNMKNVAEFARVLCYAVAGKNLTCLIRAALHHGDCVDAAHD